MGKYTTANLFFIKLLQIAVVKRKAALGYRLVII